MLAARHKWRMAGTAAGSVGLPARLRLVEWPLRLQPKLRAKIAVPQARDSPIYGCRRCRTFDEGEISIADASSAGC